MPAIFLLHLPSLRCAAPCAEVQHLLADPEFAQQLQDAINATGALQEWGLPALPALLRGGAELGWGAGQSWGGI